MNGPNQRERWMEGFSSCLLKQLLWFWNLKQRVSCESPICHEYSLCWPHTEHFIWMEKYCLKYYVQKNSVAASCTEKRRHKICWGLGEKGSSGRRSELQQSCHVLNLPWFKPWLLLSYPGPNTSSHVFNKSSFPLLFPRGLGTQDRPERAGKVRPILTKKRATHLAMWFTFTFVSILDITVITFKKGRETSESPMSCYKSNETKKKEASKHT